MQALATKVGRDLTAQLADSPLDGAAAKQNPQFLRVTRAFHQAPQEKLATV
jgi:hypothetical protein